MRKYSMDRTKYQKLAQTLKNTGNATEIIENYTDCLLDMMLNDLDFLCVTEDKKMRDKIKAFNSDLKLSVRL